MKKLRQLLTAVTLALAIGFVLMDCQEVKAAPAERAQGIVYVNPQYVNGEMVWKSVKKMRMTTNNDARFKVYFGNEGEYITDIKVDKKGLKADLIQQYSGYWSKHSGNCYATIGLCAEKSGTYKVSFKVRNQAGAAKSYKMIVYCTDDSNWYTEIKIGSQTAYSQTISQKGTTFTTKYLSNFKVPSNMTSAKLSIKPNKGYAITGVVVIYRDKNGVPKTMKTKNNRNIKLSQQYNTRNYGSDGVYSKPSKMHTEVFVSRKDKYLGTYVQYSVVKKSGVKMIKCVEKLSDGTKRTSYSSVRYAGGNLDFWRN